MSFEFEKPTGFSPCGLVFGVLREGHAYSAPCRTYADGEIDNRIIWYFVPPDRPVYEGVNAFEPRVDNIYDLKHETMEVSRLSPCPRKHYSGRDIWFREGDAVDGDEEDFAGRSLKSKYWIGGVPPQDPCVEPPHGFNEIGFGVRRRMPTVEKHKQRFKLGGECSVLSPPAGDLGLMLGGVATQTNSPAAPSIARLALGGVLTFIPAPALELDAGLALGGVMLPSPAPAIPLDTGIGLGGVMLPSPAPAIPLDSGIALGGEMTFIPAPAIELNTGIALGGEMTFIPAPAIELNTGIALGGECKHVTAADTPFEPMLALGSEISGESVEGVALERGLLLGGLLIVEGGGGPGGVDCEHATVMELGVEYTDTWGEMESKWYMFPFTVSVPFHLTIVSKTGGTFQMNCSYGESCAGLTFWNVLNEAGDCRQANPGASLNMYIQAIALIGSVTATIKYDSGLCP